MTWTFLRRTLATPAAPDADAVLALGRPLLAVMRANPEPRTLGDALADWALQDPAFKIELFRLVDVLPRLTDADAVVEHLRQYLMQPGLKPPTAVAALVRSAGLAPGIAAGTFRRQVEIMAGRFIAAADAAGALPIIRSRWDSGIPCTVDLVGEACVSAAEARVYRDRYLDLIRTLGGAAPSWPARQADCNHLGPVPRAGVSIKLSSLADRYTPLDPEGSAGRCLEILRPILEEARRLGVTVTFDVEQHELKDLNWLVFTRCAEAVAFPAGLAMQAYLRSADADAERIIAWTKRTGRTVTVRVVKGAYWDQEVAWARERSWPIPVWTDKAASDAACERVAARFLAATPTRAGEPGVLLALGSHNLRTVAATAAAAQARGLPPSAVEYQVLHGMGHGLKTALLGSGRTVREYVPVGALLPGMAYLVRRLLENTSNRSWLLGGLDLNTPAEAVLAAPQPLTPEPEPAPPAPLLPGVPGLAGGSAYTAAAPRDFSDGAQRVAFAAAVAAAILPATRDSDAAGMTAAIDRAQAAAARWRDRPALERAALIERAADRMAADRDRLAAAVVVGAAKPWRDADAEICEAIDFCRYYARLAAARGEPARLGRIPGEDSRMVWEPRGVAGVIAPWNFPFAIAGGMTVAALVAGNPTILKPAEQTPGIAALLVDHLHAAGVPSEVVQLVCGPGETAGAALVDDPRVMTIAFTGSRAVGTMIAEQAARWRPGQAGIRRVASEMGGKNAIVVDTTADLDEAVAGIRASAFGYAGQKCSACSRLIVVDAVADALLDRLVPACADLVVGDPRHPATDLGPVIDHEAGERIRGMIARARADGLGMLLADDRPRADLDGRPVIGPHIIADVPTGHPLATVEVFGPVLAVFRVPDVAAGIDLAMASPYRLTGGLYSRTPAHLALARERFRVGNLYLNRGITGAIVGRHPFGGTGWSGTGAKAGGPDYLTWFSDARVITEHTLRRGMAAELING